MIPSTDVSEHQGIVHVHRERLLNLLGQGTQHKLVLITAGAGYGKTTLMSEFVRSRGVRTVWVALNPSHQDPALLSDALESALRDVSDAEIVSINPLTHPDTPPTSLSVHRERLRRLAAHACADGALIILDDYQRVEESEEANLLLGSLIQNSPANLRFAILSRGAPKLPIGQLRSRQQVYSIGEEDLAFTRDETEEFLRKGHCLMAGPSAVDLVQSRTEGWPAGVATICHSCKCSPQINAMEILGNPQASTWLVWDYFAEEVLNQETPFLQDFMIRTSILNTLTPDTCDSLLGLASSRTILLDLERRSLFIRSVDPAKERFRYHGLFQEFLQQNLHQRKPAEVSTLHLKAAQFYAERTEWDECVKHYLGGEQPEVAARIVETIGLEQILSGSPQKVRLWLGALPESIVDTRPRLLALQGYLGHTQNGSTALLALERALWLFKNSGDAEGQAWASLSIGVVEWQDRHPTLATNWYKSALDIAKPGSWLSSWLLAFLGAAYCSLGMLKESAEVLRQAIDGLPAIDDEEQRNYCYSLALAFTAETQVAMGDIEEARLTVQNALAIGASRQMSRYELGPIDHIAGVVAWIGCDFDTALRYLTRASTVGVPGPRAARITQQYVGNCLRDTGRWDEAAQAYDSCTLDGELEDAFMAILRGEGHAVWNRVAKLSARVSQDESIFERVALEVVMAELLREEHRYEQALLHLRPVTELLAERGCIFNYVGAMLHQSRIEYELGRPADGRRSLLRAFGFASTKSLYHFPWWDSRLVAYLCQIAATEGVHSEYAAELAMRRLSEDTLTRFGLPPHGPKDAPEQFLASCPDPDTRESLRECLREALLTEKGLRILRRQYRLTWRELEIFVEYYLRPATVPVGTGAQLRSECARRLKISDNTMQCHVNNIRGKLALPKSVMGRAVLVWARKQGVLGEKHIGSDEGSTAPHIPGTDIGRKT